MHLNIFYQRSMVVIFSFNNVTNQSHLKNRHIIDNLDDKPLVSGHFVRVSHCVRHVATTTQWKGVGRGKPVIVSGLPTNEYISPPQRLSARSAPLEVGSSWALMTRQLVSAQARSSLPPLCPSSGLYFSLSTWEK